MSVSLSDFDEKIEKLKSWRDNDGDMLPPDELLKGVLSVANDASRYHRAYNHYTSIEAFKKIFKEDGESTLRLSRLTSITLNDNNECGKYIPYQTAKQTFVTCFNHECAECANLWWLYAKGSASTIRITFPAEAFARWCDQLSKEHGKSFSVVDVVYAAVKGDKDETCYERRNTLRWDDHCVFVEGLDKFLGDPKLAGRLKDYEWRCERETRIILSEKTDARFCEIKIPDFLISKMRITTSPWVTDAEYESIKEEVQCHLKGRWKLTQKKFRPSVLERSMNALVR